MKYDFPLIKNIDDVLPAIKNNDEFIVVERNGFTVINYVYSAENTFLGDNFELKRECRGIVFDKDGALVSRRFHKFFNLFEKEETHIDNVNFNNNHLILDKADGSMITPIFDKFKNKFYFGSKMIQSEVAENANYFAHTNEQYLLFAKKMYEQNKTPIFEWCSPKNRIVVNYDRDQLILTAIRDNLTGEYMSYDDMMYYSKFNIPIIKAYDSFSNIHDQLDQMKQLQNIEGFVIRFNNGHMIKIKTDEYVQFHKSKDLTQNPANIIRIILADKIDDLKSMVKNNDLETLRNVESEFYNVFNKFKNEIENKLLYFKKKYGEDRKEFSLNEKHEKDFIRNAYFSSLKPNFEINDYVKKVFLNNLSKNIDWERFCVNNNFGKKLYTKPGFFE